MPYSDKPIPPDRRNSLAASCGQRIQACWWTASDERKAALADAWPELAVAIEALDRVLKLPVITPEKRYAFGSIPGRPGDGP